MAVFKTIEQIKQDIWSNSSDEILDPLKFPKQNLLYDKKQLYSIEDIECWQEIYYQPGNIGLYAAWSPYVECYIIVHNLFLNSSVGIEIYGDHTSTEQIDKIVTRMRQFGIDIPLEIIQI